MRVRKRAEIRVRVLRHGGSKADKAAVGGLWWVGERNGSRREVMFGGGDEEEERESGEEKVRESSRVREVLMRPLMRRRRRWWRWRVGHVSGGRKIEGGKSVIWGGWG